MAQSVPQRFRQRGLPRRGRQEVAGGYLAPAAPEAPESYVTPAAEAPALYSGQFLHFSETLFLKMIPICSPRGGRGRGR